MSKILEGGEYNGLSWAITDGKELILGRDGESQVCDRRGQEFDERDVIEDSWSSWVRWNENQHNGLLIYNEQGKEKTDRDYYREENFEFDEDWPWILQEVDWTEFIGAESRVWVYYAPLYPIDKVTIKGDVTLRGDLSSLFEVLDLDDYPEGYEHLMIEDYDGEVLNYKEYNDKINERAEKAHAKWEARDKARKEERNKLREQGLTDEEIDAKEAAEKAAELERQEKEIKKRHYENRKPIFLNGVSVKCIHDYTTKAGDKDNYVRVSLPFGKIDHRNGTIPTEDSWLNMILPKGNIKDSKNPSYKNVMIYDIETYPVLLDGDKKKIRGSMLKFKFDFEREKAKNEQKEVSPEEPQGGDEKTDDKVLE